MRKTKKHLIKSNKLKKLTLLICTVVFIVGICYISYYFYAGYRNKKENKNLINNIEINKNDITDTKTERMLQLEEIQKENEEIRAWLEIEGTNINYPVLQTTDNDFYTTHNYKKEKSSSGSIFLDKDVDLTNGSTNYLIYGHRVKSGIMFEDLMKYENKSFYEKHKTIKFTDNKEDAIYEIVAVFYSRVYYKKEKDVFRYYYFINAENEKEYNEFIYNAKKSSIYDTGVTPVYGDQLLTLSTCSYHTEDGRFAIVCRKVDK